MISSTRNERLLPQFRRVLAYLGPHRRLLVIGLLSAVGVSASYTFSISAIVPVLKIMFANHETMADWLHRTETERRLGIILAADLPDDPAGLRIDDVRPTSPVAESLRMGDRIVQAEGQSLSSYELMRLLAQHREEDVSAVLRAVDGQERVVRLSLAPYSRWRNELQRVAGLLPSGGDAHSRLLTLAIAMGAVVVIAIVGGICRFANDGLVCTAVQRALHDMRSQIGAHVLRLPMQWHAEQPPGDTLARLATDINKVEVGLTTLFGKMIREPLKAVGVLTLTVLIEWRLLVIAAVGLPIGVLLLRVFGRLVKRAQRRASESWGRLLDHLGERLAGIRVVKACNMQPAESRRFEREGRRLTHAQTHIELVDAATKPALETLATVAVAAFVLYGGSLVFQQKLEAHLFFAAVVCLGGVFDPIRKLGNVNNRLQAAEASARRLFELLDLPPEERTATEKSAVELPPLQQSIEFRGVSFAYPASTRPVLHGINLLVARGETLALVGPNGSGKTTLVSLLLRFFEPTAGQILIDGQDIADCSLASLRSQIGLVTQEAVIFSDSLRDNIGYGVTDRTEEQLRAAAGQAHVAEFVDELESRENGRARRGYDAQITARTLSGGQRQRVALARAVLRDPPILILDEATSQVDSESERKIQAALDNVTRDRTTIIIAHRYSTIARADRIAVLDEGRLVGCGRHDALLHTCPLYATLCHTQFAHAV